LSLFLFMNATSRSSICAASGLIGLLLKSNKILSDMIVRSTSEPVAVVAEILGFGDGGGRGGAGFGAGGGGGTGVNK
jgi:hypothetical protein